MFYVISCHEYFFDCYVCYVYRSDIDSSLTALEYCVKNYNKVPNYGGILKLLIDAEDADKLQKGICSHFVTV